MNQPVKATSQTDAQATPGFSFRIDEHTHLAVAILLLHSEHGEVEVIGICSSIAEARQMAKADISARHRDLEAGDSPLCPEYYTLSARGIGGRFTIAARIEA